MIRALRVRNLAVIEEIDLEFGPGLNVITGETGAGKSLLVGAIGLLRGQRATSEVVRAGASEASAEAIIDSPRLLARARELGLARDDDSELLVRRGVSREGRGRVYVNGALATATLLAELLGDALEIVSQAEHQRLLRPEVQADLLDRYGGLGDAALEVEELYRGWRDLSDRIRERRARAEELARREDQLRFEVDQIEAADLRPGEIEELEGEWARLAHVDRLAQETGAALAELESDGGLLDRLASMGERMRAAAGLDPALEGVAESLARARLELDEAEAALQRYSASLEADPERLERVEARLNELARLQARYGATVEAILSHRDAARAELERISGGEARTAELEAGREQAARALDDAAQRLSKARQQAAAELQAEVTREVRALDLRGALFEVRFDPAGVGLPGEAAAGPHGRERARFLLAANPGEATQRLRNAASGGELARLLLALRNVLRDAEPGGALLFDEIDAGIGGRTALRVGERLRSLAHRHQILCITHLPQIAAFGATHYRLLKRVRGGRTSTRAERLDAEARVDEIARLAGGGKLTQAARAHARELLAAG